MGIISGFMGGLGQGMAQAGQMMLADKLMKEREEANFLRDSALRRDLQSSRQTFESGETDRRLTHAENLQTTREEAANARSTAELKSRESEGDKNRQNALDVQNAKPAKNPQTVTYTDPNTGLEQPAVLQVTAGGGYQLIDPMTNKPVDLSEPEVVEANEDKGWWASLFGGDGDTPAPDVSRETSVTPNTNSSKPVQYKNGDEAYAGIKMRAGDSFDEEKAKKAVKARFPDWKGPPSSVIDISPIKDAGAADKPPLTDPVPATASDQTGKKGLVSERVNRAEQVESGSNGEAADLRSMISSPKLDAKIKDLKAQLQSMTQSGEPKGQAKKGWSAKIKDLKAELEKAEKIRESLDK